jgi:hypothetical protein
MAIFVSYCPQFWGSRGIYMGHDTQYMFERHDQKLVVFTFSGHFCELLSTVLGFLGWFSRPMILGSYLTCMTKHLSFLCIWPFLWAISHCFGVLGDLHGPWHLVHVWEAWPKTHRFCVLGSWAIAHCFGFSRWFTRPMTLTKCLRGMTKNPSFLRFWAEFWVSGVILKAHDT